MIVNLKGGDHVVVVMEGGQILSAQFCMSKILRRHFKADFQDIDHLLVEGNFIKFYYSNYKNQLYFQNLVLVI